MRWYFALPLVLVVGLTAGRVAARERTDPQSLLSGVPSTPTTYADGHYAFLNTQPGNPTMPIGYNPCRRIPIEVNFANATPDILPLLNATIRDINTASGLHLDYGGASMRTRRTSGITGRILLSFDDITHDPALTDAAGMGGSAFWLGSVGSTVYYVSGTITLNTAEFNHYSRHAQSIVLSHEIGHTLGLAHTQGDEVMASGNYGTSDWGHGDLSGLARLGALPCR